MKNTLFPFILFLLTSCLSQERSNSDIKSSRVPEIGEIVEEIKSSTIIFQDKDNNYWFAGNSEGVYYLNNQEVILYSTKDGLCSNAILSIQEDKQGNLYFDTQDGISRFDGKQFSTLKITESQTNDKNWKLEPDDLWFRKGWDSDGPYRYDGKDLYHLKFPENNKEKKFRSLYPNISYNPYGIYSIYKDSKGSMWFGTSSLGIYRFDGNTISWMYEDALTNTPEGGAFGIRSIIEDKDGYFWICNTIQKFEIATEAKKGKSLSLIDYKERPGITSLNAEGKLNFTYYMSVVEDEVGDLWFLTYSGGVYHFDGETYVHYPIVENGEQILLFSIYKDNDGMIWLGTQNDGVYKYNGSNFEKFKV